MSPEEAQQLQLDSQARQAERTSGIFERTSYEKYDHVVQAKELLPKTLAAFRFWLNTPQGRFAQFYAARSR